MISDAYIQLTGKIPQLNTSKKMKQNATNTHWEVVVLSLSMTAIMTMQKEHAAEDQIRSVLRPTLLGC